MQLTSQSDIDHMTLWSSGETGLLVSDAEKAAAVAAGGGLGGMQTCISLMNDVGYTVCSHCVYK